MLLECSFIAFFFFFRIQAPTEQEHGVRVGIRHRKVGHRRHRAHPRAAWIRSPDGIPAVRAGHHAEPHGREDSSVRRVQVLPELLPSGSRVRPE